MLAAHTSRAKYKMEFVTKFREVALPIILLFEYFPILKSDFEIGNTADEIRLNKRFGGLQYHKNGMLKCIRLHHQMKARGNNLVEIHSKLLA